MQRFASLQAAAAETWLGKRRCSLSLDLAPLLARWPSEQLQSAAVAG
jgi:hypothetical protein